MSARSTHRITFLVLALALAAPSAAYAQPLPLPLPNAEARESSKPGLRERLRASLPSLRRLRPSSRSSGRRPLRSLEVEIVDRRGVTLGEFDEIDLLRRILYEDKSARGLERVDSVTSPEAWAKKQIYGKTVVRIENLPRATATRPTRNGSPVIPSLAQVLSLRRLVFRIESSDPAVRVAVDAQVTRLRARYPAWSFGAKYGTSPPRAGSPFGRQLRLRLRRLARRETARAPRSGRASRPGTTRPGLVGVLGRLRPRRGRAVLDRAAQRGARKGSARR